MCGVCVCGRGESVCGNVCGYVCGYVCVWGGGEGGREKVSSANSVHGINFIPSFWTGNETTIMQELWH